MADEFSREERIALDKMLSRIIALCSVEEQAQVTRHMDLLQCLVEGDAAGH